MCNIFMLFKIFGLDLTLTELFMQSKHNANNNTNVMLHKLSYQLIKFIQIFIYFFCLQWTMHLATTQQVFFTEIIIGPDLYHYVMQLGKKSQVNNKKKI